MEKEKGIAYFILVMILVACSATIVQIRTGRNSEVNVSASGEADSTFLNLSPTIGPSARVNNKGRDTVVVKEIVFDTIK